MVFGMLRPLSILAFVTAMLTTRFIHAQDEVITTAGALLEKSAATLRTRSFEVRLEGVVTLQATNFPWIFVHESTGDFLVHPLDSSARFRPGDKVQVEGVTGLGTFAPFVRRASVKVTGSAPLPAPVRPNVAQLCDGSHFGRLVEIDAVVTSVHQGQGEIWLEIVGQEQTKSIVVQNAAGLPPASELIGARVRAQGIDWPTNERNGFFLRVTNAGSVSILEPPSVLSRYDWILPAAGSAIGTALVLWLLVGWRRERVYEKLAKSEKRLRTLYDRSPDATLMFDLGNAAFLDCNEAALRLLRCERDWLIGKKPWELAPLRQPCGTLSEEKAAQITERVSRSGSLLFEWQHRRADGTDFPAEISVTALDFDHRVQWLCVVRDVTSRKEAEAALRTLNQELEQQVSERTSELLAAQEELHRNLQRERELGDLKSNFVSMVSHEFRTPLGVISSSAQILDRYFARLDEEERHEHLGAINASVKRMAGMMEDVLVLSRVDSGRMDFSPAPLALGDLCRRLLDEFASAHGGEVDLQIAPEAEPPAAADENIVRHILTNLLTNARKYSPAERPIHLSLARDGSVAVFTVRDEGIGIPEKDQARLFEAFHRGGNVGNINGTGLGLVIVRRCCERHGGTVSVSSREGAGTTFTVRLPVFSS